MTFDVNTAERTEWFWDVCPSLPGIYERKFKEIVLFAHWNGTFWAVGAYSQEMALRQKERRSIFESLPWRGLKKRCESGDTPKTDAALCQLRYYETRSGGRYEEQLTYIEPEFARELERELARAMRVVEAAKDWNASICIRTGDALRTAVKEWGAGR